MNNLPPNASNSDNLQQEVAQELLQKLRQKQGNWVEWGKAIAKLQKAGYNPQTIFEDTGFEPIQQNQVVVGAQVYNSLETNGASEPVRSHYQQRGSDILYELRLLAQEERVAAAELTFAHQLNCEEAKEIARAIKDYSRLRNLPENFSAHAGDAITYQCWKIARQKSDLQERSHLIARGLKFAHSESARKQIEKLLTDFTVVPQRPAPTLPVYRLESEAELPRILPVVGELPLTPEDLQAVPRVSEIGSFGIVKFSGEQAWVGLPGWQVILNAEDALVIGCNSDRLPAQNQSVAESVLVVIDRAQRTWDSGSYFVVENSGEIDFQWFETAPEVTILGKVVVIVRPKKILDEEVTKETWLIDE
ncbi:MAG: RuBisCO accumulation factor 1 [Cyanobacteria bacterium P01_A01_bin.84]